jgi:uncharacterized protein (DUF2249 family)
MPVLDLRPLPPAERHQQVHAQLDALGPGETLELVNDHRPAPLRYELEATRAGQYEWSDGDDGPERSTAAITCRARIVDARPILAQGGEPFDTIMAAVAALGPDEPLVVLAPFEPVPLEGVLSAQGFTWDAEALGGGDWRVVFRPPS